MDQERNKLSADQRFDEMISLVTRGFHDMDNNYRELREEVKVLTTTFETRFNQLETRFDQLETKFNQLETRFNQLETRFDQLETRFVQLETRFDQLEGRVIQVEGKLVQFEGRFDRLENDLAAFKKETERNFQGVNFKLEFVINELSKIDRVIRYEEQYKNLRGLP